MDFATTTSPIVQAQLDRLAALSPGADVLGLDRIARLLERLGDPNRALPPVFHVAGTNGKGSTCAYLRAAIEATGRRVHVYTSPHLVRFNERIRLAGTLIGDDALARYLARVLDVAEGVSPSFFEVSTAAAFLAFAEVPADACVIEVGLGGRLDATNVIVDPAACGIAQLGIDHEAFLGSSATGIAREKAGIAKRGRPLLTLAYPPAIAEAVAQVAAAAGAPVIAAGGTWGFEAGETLDYRDARGGLTTPAPVLRGAHQQANLALAIAMLRHQDRIDVSDDALRAAPLAARWPARMQRLSDGPLTRLLPAGSAVWLDGGHNPAAAQAVSEALTGVLDGGRANLVLGMLANKDAAGLLAPFAPLAGSLVAVPIPGHEHHPPERLAEIARASGISASVAASVADALRQIAAADGPVTVLILGSLYLAGEVLRANDQLPD